MPESTRDWIFGVGILKCIPNVNTPDVTYPVLPEINDGILPIAEVKLDETMDVPMADGVVTTEWLQTTTDGVATGWYA